MELLIQFVLLVLGFTMLVVGADKFVDGAAGIADKFGIPQMVIGLTIVAMGTSAPEAAVSVTAALKGNADITIGNVVGSNILNVLVILGLCALFTSVKIAKSTLKIELPIMLVITVMMVVQGCIGGYVTRIDGVIMWIAFIGYLTYLFVVAKNNPQSVEEDEEKVQPVWKLLLFAVAGLVLIVWGSDVTVDAATKLATAAGLSTHFIGLTIVALGTSLPELFTSVSAAKKGNADIAIGNIVGSNIFNILFVVGTSALITPVIFESKFIVDSIVAILAGVLLWVCTFKKKLLVRPHGVIMLVCYAVYFVYLLKYAETAAVYIEKILN